ncbi:MAG: FKBP-type peptidyl-prolyl cis-trans isomerase [Magnetococcus sp. WYHC-3]
MRKPQTLIAAAVLPLLCAVTMPALAGEATPAAPANLTTLESRTSYLMGREIATRLARSPIPVDRAAILAGVADALDNKPSPLSEDITRQTLQAYQEMLVARMAEQRQKIANENAGREKEFLASNGARKEVKTTASGLQYEVLSPGKGTPPSGNARVQVHYTGTLLDGTVFDDSRKRGKPVSFALDKVIKGWSEGLQLMPVGARHKLFIPSHLAYGMTPPPGTGIAPGMMLIFDVELLSIESK